MLFSSPFLLALPIVRLLHTIINIYTATKMKYFGGGIFLGKGAVTP